MAQAQILIVDDQPRMAQSLSRILSMPEGGGYRTDTAESGEEALERLKKTPFDLVITDLRMVGISGLELLKQAHLLYPNIGRILMTGYDSQEVQAEAGQVADAYIVKPINPRELVDKVRVVMQARPGAVPAAPTESQESPSLLLQRCEQLRTDVGAMGVLVLDNSGRIVTECGSRGSFDVDAFTGLLGGAMAAVGKASKLLDEEESFDLHLHQGKKYDIYTARVNQEVLLSVTIDRRGANAGTLGMVWISLRRAIGEIRTLMAQPPPAPIEKPAPVERHAPERRPLPPREPERRRPELGAIRRPSERTPKPPRAEPGPIVRTTATEPATPPREPETPATLPPASESLVERPRPKVTATSAPMPQIESPKSQDKPPDIAIPARPNSNGGPPPPPPPPPPSVFAPEAAALEDKERLTFEEALKRGLINRDALRPILGEDNKLG